ncbi:MerC domain-containing protein [Parasphingorhabdus sp.]|uniref:MerC domain-containing protein n=1 Tax=Parasphingorhabdus sp. TaxID=2709688 RepID=UPI003A8D24CE
MPISQNISRLTKKGNDLVEGAAISVSVLCLVHCLALPVLLFLLPGLLGIFVQSEIFHAAVFLVIAPFAVVAFGMGYRFHRQAVPAMLGLVGLACLAVALMPGLGEEREFWITVTGSLLLVVGHLLNWAKRRHRH